MKRVLKVLRFAVAFVCMLSLGVVVVFGQGDDEKAWDDVARLLEPRAQFGSGTVSTWQCKKG